MHQKGRVDLYNSGTSSHFLGQGCCWLAWEEKASPKHRSLLKNLKSLSKLFGARALGHIRHGQAVVFLHIFSCTLHPNRQSIFSYIHASCVTWKEKTQALNLVLQFMYFWDAVLQIYLVAMIPYQIYSKFSSNFQILCAKSWADTAQQFLWEHSHSLFICFLHLLCWTS